MNSKFIFRALAFSILGAALSAPTLSRAEAASAPKTLVLYDATSGSTPSAPVMNFTDFPPGTALPAYVDGLTVMDTTTAGRDTYAGWVANGTSTPGFPLLDRAAGFQVNFTLQLESESHANNNRAGFSLIILGQDARGIELAFWPDQIWVQGDDLTGGLFRHGEGVAFATTRDLTNYQVSMSGDAYTLTANGETILTGPVRDYSKFDGFPDPYETPNFIFLGDDTTSAQARLRLSFLSVTGTEAETPTPTPTITSTSSPVPVTSSTPLPSATPAPSPTPSARAPALCPSGWIPLALLLSTALLGKKIRGATDPP
jgi:hypothetical protein